MVVIENVSNSAIHVENLIKIKNFSSLAKLLLEASCILRFKNNLLARVKTW